jgi:hypothetical protein
LRGSRQKDRASPEVRGAGIFGGCGYCPAELPIINYQACLAAFIYMCFYVLKYGDYYLRNKSFFFKYTPIQNKASKNAGTTGFADGIVKIFTAIAPPK